MHRGETVSMPLSYGKHALSYGKHSPSQRSLDGEHNPYVYRELLGVSEVEYDRLEAEGHLGFEYAEGV